jgi:hypothetical protein
MGVLHKELLNGVTFLLATSFQKLGNRFLKKGEKSRDLPWTKADDARPPPPFASPFVEIGINSSLSMNDYKTGQHIRLEACS